MLPEIDEGMTIQIIDYSNVQTIEQFQYELDKISGKYLNRPFRWRRGDETPWEYSEREVMTDFQRLFDAILTNHNLPIGKVHASCNFDSDTKTIKVRTFNMGIQIQSNEELWKALIT